ncbi:hypothetical protein DFS34DRAFT_624749 [Phlyctochytrium arcticum]|nr:hypothetical protein DFS34DRAFT_624749 [Phlyctochytrium arcticum]
MGSVQVKNAQSINARRSFEGADVSAITGNADLVITIRNNPICFIELKKNPEQGKTQAKAEALLYLDSALYFLDRIVVLTDLNDFWQILFFASMGKDELKPRDGLFIGQVSREVALGVMQRWILHGGHQFEQLTKRELRDFETFRDLPPLPATGALEMRKTVTLPLPSEVLQLDMLRGLAKDESEDYMLRNRQRFILYANNCAPSAEPVFREMATKLATETHKRDNYISYIT